MIYYWILKLYIYEEFLFRTPEKKKFQKIQKIVGFLLLDNQN